MSRRARVLALAIVALAMLPLPSNADPRSGKAAPAVGVVERSPMMVVDLHVDIPWQVHFKGRADGLSEGHARLDTLRAGAYGGIVFPIYLPDAARPEGPRIEDADAIYGTIRRIIEKNSLFLPLLSKQAEPGRVSTWLAIEGAGAFASDPAQIDRFIDRGLRLVGPVHQKNSGLASSATGEKVHWGLTPVGKDFCRRVYEHGAMVDVSHLSDAGFADLVPIAKSLGAPIVATHSNARAVADHPRNLTDDQLRAIAETGGVAGLNFHGPFVTKGGDATLDDVAKMLEHMIKIAGIDHVAIGSDFDGGIRPPKGLEDASRFPTLAAALEKRGLSQGDILKVFSLNALRVLAWRSR